MWSFGLQHLPRDNEGARCLFCCKDVFSNHAWLNTWQASQPWTSPWLPSWVTWKSCRCDCRVIKGAWCALSPSNTSWVPEICMGHRSKDILQVLAVKDTSPVTHAITYANNDITQGSFGLPNSVHIEAILDRSCSGGKMEYLVKWLGYLTSFNLRRDSVKVTNVLSHRRAPVVCCHCSLVYVRQP